MCVVDSGPIFGCFFIGFGKSNKEMKGELIYEDYEW